MRSTERQGAPVESEGKHWTLGWGTGLEMLPTASSPMAGQGREGPATMDPDVPIEEKLAGAEQRAASESRAQPPELEGKGREAPCTTTLALSKGEAKREGKSEASARALSSVDAEVAVGPTEQGGGWSLTRGSPQLLYSCG